MDNIIGISADKRSVEETLYAVMVSEAQRLKKAISHYERSEIRRFIVQCFQLLESEFEKDRRASTPTCELVDQLAVREGVTEHIVDPYEKGSIDVSGPARVLVVID